MFHNFKDHDRLQYISNAAKRNANTLSVMAIGGKLHIIRLSYFHAIFNPLAP